MDDSRMWGLIISGAIAVAMWAGVWFGTRYILRRDAREREEFEKKIRPLQEDFLKEINQKWGRNDD